MKKNRLGVVEFKLKEGIEKIDELLLKMETENKDKVFSISREEIYGELPKSKYDIEFSTEFYGIGKEPLIQVKKELLKALEYLNKKLYLPIYGRFIIDFQTNKEGEEFISYLLEILNFYEKYT